MFSYSLARAKKNLARREIAKKVEALMSPEDWRGMKNFEREKQIISSRIEELKCQLESIERGEKFYWEQLVKCYAPEATENPEMTYEGKSYLRQEFGYVGR
jgi:hypothetical protein